jgi:hypothetical protein
MDLLDALTISMLPVSRERAAFALKELCNPSASGCGDELPIVPRLAEAVPDIVLAVLAACRVPDDQRDAAAALARSRAHVAIDAGAAGNMIALAIGDPR